MNMAFRQMTVPVANATPVTGATRTNETRQIELTVPNDPEKGIQKQKPLVFTQVHVHPTPPATQLTFIQRTASRFHNCSSSVWICVGLFGFLFVLLLLGMSNSGDCVSSDNWLFCDNHPHTHSANLDHSADHDHNQYIFPLFVFLFIGSIFACFWFSDRRSYNW